MSTGKNPYELRLDLLQLAYDICMERHRANFAEKYNSAMSTREGLVGMPTSPTTEEVIEEAKKLYSFVEKK